MNSVIRQLWETQTWELSPIGNLSLSSFLPVAWKEVRWEEYLGHERTLVRTQGRIEGFLGRV